MERAYPPDPSDQPDSYGPAEPTDSFAQPDPFGPSDPPELSLLPPYRGHPMARYVPAPRRRRRKDAGPPVPTLRFERELWNEGLARVVGVDEVGVAPTCGAVMDAAVVMNPGCHRIPGVRDSKTLSQAQRERLYPIIRRRAVAVALGAASVTEIDRLNIYHATHLAMRRAVARVGAHDHVLIDGRRIIGFEDHAGPYTAIIDGDARCYTIACASIVAKVIRDRLMARLAARYPVYGWEHNRGYSSPDHRAAIAAHGVTPHHRRSFATVRIALAGEQVAFDLLGLAEQPPVLDEASDSITALEAELSLVASS